MGSDIISYDDGTPAFDNDETVFKYGANLRSARKKAGMTQIEAAKEIGIAVNSLRLYEADKRMPSLKTMCVMADVYLVTLDYLFTGKDSSIGNHSKTRLLNAFDRLNYEGKQRAAERVEELAEIPKYQLSFLKESGDDADGD